ncbi:bifunctional helix-turn-helix transcriptional regulator/GNAT family N-acetyltransferase [Nocardia jejuensis]|uniref:bifunctional helix-turn-helix transcriptional regulator/GNAT family N-acetyltransferase n=1 Tax=Nocardia jejuensis TaxID=328049 RepID=UPI000A009E0E|nr:helix-turn-helix domain-containing GNAT family N-acetyltransferase [Nocardia jejuensis]
MTPHAPGTSPTETPPSAEARPAPAAHSVDIRHIDAVRAFNRHYTRIIGVLRSGLLGTEFSLTEARILFELANFGPAEVVGLRRALDLDAGYLSRILAKFEGRALVARRRSDVDGRRQVVELTGAGRTAFAELDERTQRDIGRLLGPHSPATRAHLIGAMHTIERILDAPAAADTTAVTLRAPRPGDHGWVIQRNGAIYAEEFGWTRDYEALVARIVADFLDSHDPQRERAWIAEHDSVPVGSVFCMRESDTTARLRVLLVEPSVRGLGVGSALVTECVRFAASAGYREIVLWTTATQVAARRIYERAGFQLVQEDPQHLFGHDLLGQQWRRELA